MGVGGYVIPSEINSFNQKFCARFSPLRPVAMDFETLNVGARLMKYYAKSVQTNMFAEYLVGANMSFRKSALSKVGFFPAEIRFGGDDSYICRLMRAEYGDRCLSVLDTLEMKHEFPKSFKDSLRRSYRYGNGSGKNFSRGNGSFSFNPGPILILSFLLLFLTCHLILGASIRDALSRSLVFFPLEILFYAFFVTRDKSALPRFFIQRIKLGLAFLVSETANSVGFISGLRFPFGDYREYS